MIDRIPKLVAAQPEGVCPIYRAYESHADHIARFGKMFTVAHGVAKQVLEDGVIKKGERVVCVTTGSGLKAASLLAKNDNYSVYTEKLEDLDKFCKERL